MFRRKRKVRGRVRTNVDATSTVEILTCTAWGAASSVEGEDCIPDLYRICEVNVPTRIFRG